MTITYPLSLPTTKGVAKIHLQTVNVTPMAFSPVSLVQQIQELQGKQWRGTVSLPPMKRADAAPWIAFLKSLKGRKGTFLMGDPLAVARGSLGGVPLVMGGSQTGNSLIIDGCTPSITGWAKADDYFHMVVNSQYRLYSILKDVNTNGSGQATLDLWPDLREAPADNTALVFTNPTGQFRLEGPSPEWDEEPIVYNISFAAVEAI